MAAKPWERQYFKRLNLKLSASAPILLWWHNHPRKAPLSFDMHYACELGVVCKGSIVRRYRDCQLRLRAGDVWLCGLWEPHGGDIVEAPSETIAFAVLPETLALTRYPELPQMNWAAPFMAPPQQRPRATFRTVPEILNLMRYLKRGVQSHGGTPPPLLLRFVVMEVLRVLMQDWKTGGVEISPEQGRQVNQAIQLVFERKGCLSAADATRACGMSRRNFDRIFLRIMGLSFPAFALRYRLHGVAGKLLGSADPLKSVASEWGFSDASHLVHRFEELFGCTPNEYRSPVRTKN